MRKYSELFVIVLLISGFTGSALVFAETNNSVSSVADSSVQPFAHENLNSTAWYQTAAEFHALARQTYNNARRMLEMALEDKNWTAAMEQKGDYQNLPPAIILDVDETVLDNSPYQARLIYQNKTYDPRMWKQWCLESKCKPVPGAVEFTQFARSKGVTVFFVTNRRAELEAATRKNLALYNFPLDDDRDTLLMKWEQKNWPSDKRSRRQKVAKNFRIIMLIGDNLGDFTSGYKSSIEKRKNLVENLNHYWGKKWIILPNPGYGSWENAITKFRYPITDKEKLADKFKMLRLQ